MNRLLTPAVGTLLLRIALGSVLLAHIMYLKVMVYGMAGTAQFFASIGLPEILAYLVCTVEIIAGAALILGLYTRVASLAVIPILLGATWAHMGSGWLFTNTGGGWEYPFFLTIMAFVQASLGDGQYAISERLAHSA